MPSCPATVTLWAEFRRLSPSGKATLYGFPVEPVEAWVPNWAHKATTGEAGPHGSRYAVKLEVRRSWLEENFPGALAKLEAGKPRRVLAVPPALVRTQESPDTELEFSFRRLLVDSRLADEEAAVVLGLTAKQVGALRRGFLRVATGQELDRVAAAFREELQRQARVSGVPTEDGR